MSKTLSDQVEQEAPAAEKITPLVRSAVQFAESRNNRFSAIIPREVDKVRLLQSGLWSVVSDQFRSMDRIDCIWADRSAYAELLVIDAGRGFCHVLLLNHWPLPALLVSTEGLPPGFDIRYEGPDAEAQWCCYRLADNVRMVCGKPSRDAALAALLDSATLR